MNIVRKAATEAQSFVYRHRVALAVVLTAVVCQKINHSAIEQHNAFLTEHNLFDAFYSPES